MRGSPPPTVGAFEIDTRGSLVVSCQLHEIMAYNMQLALTSGLSMLEYINLDFEASQSCFIESPEALFSNSTGYSVLKGKLMHYFNQLFFFFKLSFIKI